MVQRSQNAGLPLESSKALGVLRHLLQQELDRHLSTELRVFRTINLSHAALAAQLDNLVGAQTGTWL